MVEKRTLEVNIEQVTILIERLSLEDNETEDDQKPEEWKYKEQNKETIPEGRKILKRGVQSGWRRGKLEEVRRASTTSGTSHQRYIPPS